MHPTLLRYCDFQGGGSVLATMDVDGAQTSGGQLGPFKLLRLLGEGSHGAVWLAEQQEPRRQVALKMLRSTGAGPELLSRFRRESALLAMLDHPGIAKLYASGSIDTATGAVPYLAMEYVDGATLLDYATSRQLSTRERVALIAEICRAVHHAHTRGIVHRDLKPGNVLVDENGRPRIIDFGVASVLNRSDLTQMTQAGSVLGTLPYMSPEQIVGTTVSADPRWDVYALGAIGYELLCGQLPFPELSAQTSVIGAMRILAAGSPQPLSRRLRDAAGDLNTIIMKALAHAPEARYGSAAELAADLERWLDHRPIEARKPTLRYMLGLFVRRHRIAAIAAAVVLVTLVSTTLVSIGFALREAQARQQAELRTAERDSVNDFLIDMLLSADPEHDRSSGVDITVREWLANADQNFDARADTLPDEVRQQLAQTLGRASMHLGDGDRALRRLREAHELAARLYGEDAPETLSSAIAISQAEARGPRATEAEAELRGLIARTEHLQNAELRTAAGIALAIIFDGGDRLTDALDASRDTYQYAQERLGPDHLLTLNAQHNLAVMLKASGDFIGSEAMAREVYARRAALLGETHPITLYSLNHLGTLQERLGRAEDAEALYRQALAARQASVGERHPNTLATLSNLNGLLIQQGRLDEAEPLLETLVTHTRARFGAEGPRTLIAMTQRAYVLEDRGKLEEAEQQLREILAVLERRDGPSHPEQLAPRSNLAMLLNHRGRHAEAVAQMRNTVELAQTSLGPNHPYVGIFRSNYGHILTGAGQLQDARSELETAQVILDTLGSDHPRAVKNRERLLAVDTGN